MLRCTTQKRHWKSCPLYPVLISFFTLPHIPIIPPAIQAQVWVKYKLKYVEKKMLVAGGKLIIPKAEVRIGKPQWDTKNERMILASSQCPGPPKRESTWKIAELKGFGWCALSIGGKLVKRARALPSFLVSCGNFYFVIYRRNDPTAPSAPHPPVFNPKNQGIWWAFKDSLAAHDKTIRYRLLFPRHFSFFQTSGYVWTSKKNKAQFFRLCALCTLAKHWPRIISSSWRRSWGLELYGT